MLKKLRTIITNTNPAPLETILSFESVLLGMWLLLPMNTFSTANTFKMLAVWPGELAVGSILVCLGLARAYALVLKKTRLRWNIAVVGMVVWSYIDLSFFISNPASTAVVTYFVFVILSAWILSALTWKIING